jgi:hypothetical protein
MTQPKYNWRSSEMVDNSPLPAVEFQYRNNGDGTWDSICLRCFLTVGTATSVADLAQLETVHDCYLKKPPKADHPATA